MNTQCCCCSYCSLIPRLFRIGIQSVSFDLWAIFATAIAFTFFSVHKQHWEYPRRWNNLGDASRGVEMAKVFLVHFSGVLVCAKKRFPLLRVSNCQPRNLPTNSTLKYFFPDLFWFNPNQGRSSSVSGRCQGFLETSVSDTSKQLSAKRQNNFPVADEKRNQKWTWNQKLLWNTFILENNRTTKTR